MALILVIVIVILGRLESSLWAHDSIPSRRIGGPGTAWDNAGLDRIDSVRNAGKDGEGRSRDFPQPFHLDIFAYKLTTQIFFDPVPKNSATFITGITQPESIILGASFEGKLSWGGWGKNRTEKGKPLQEWRYFGE